MSTEVDSRIEMVSEQRNQALNDCAVWYSRAMVLQEQLASAQEQITAKDARIAELEAPKLAA